MANVRSYLNHIDGQDVRAIDGKFIERFNPANGELVAVWPDSGSADVDRAVEAAVAAYKDGRWSGLKGSDRSEVLRAVSHRLKTDYHGLALIESQETGKALSQAGEEIQWSGDIWDYAAGLARSVTGETHNTLGDDRIGFVLREPIGPVGIIAPWNYPIVVLSQKLPYALAAGCTIVCKPSELTSGTALALAQILKECGLPPGVFNVVTGYGSTVGQRIAEHHALRLVSFTGSTATAKKIVTASTGNMKKVVLELGGKNPTVVFADADFESAVDGAIKGFTYNSGAECCSGSRVFVERSIADKFVARLIEKLAEVKVGDPLDPENHLGAIISKAQYNRILSFIEEGRQSGTLVYGGRALQEQRGLFIEPTVFTNVPSNAAIAREEIFGPVVVVTPFDGVEEAIVLANDTEYGLASSVWTSNLHTALMMSRNIRAGMVWVNTFLDVPSEMPIGGMKQSGYGREHGKAGLEEFLALKSVIFQNPASPS